MDPEYPQGVDAEAAARAFLADHSLGIESPEILRIAWEVRRLKAAGEDIFDLTLGDFDSAQFPPPPALVSGVGRHLEAGRTNYPPADGIAPLRRSIAAFYERRLGVRFPVESILVGAGARPLLYSVYGSTLAAGDLLVYSAPSWNNEHYAYLNRARVVVLEGLPEANFLPTLADVAPYLAEARVLHLNSPLNPAGTMMAETELAAICEAVVAENRRRSATGAKALILLFDMVYWLLAYGEREFRHPVALVPEVAPYIVTIDAVSKWMAATGLRVGWAVVPPHAQPKIKALGSHMGAWAPHAEQHAVAAVLDDERPFEAYLSTLRNGLEERLMTVWRAVESLRGDGHDVEAIRPQGAFYLSVRLDLVGRRTSEGELLENPEQVREYLLRHGRVGLIPFSAFGSRTHEGWYRVSVAGLDVAGLELATAALADAIRAVRPARVGS
jgi:aspartate aminotransferase